MRRATSRRGRAHAELYPWWLGCLAWLLTGSTASAELDPLGLLASLGPNPRARTSHAAEGDEGASPSRLGPALLDSAKLRVLLDLSDAQVSLPDVARVGSRWGVAQLDRDALWELRQVAPEVRVHWAAPRRFLLDRAQSWTGARRVHTQLGWTGKGVAIGIIDTGIDLRHPDLRHPSGATRVAWLVDFSEPPRGVHAAEALCEQADLPCAIYAADELDAILDGRASENEPVDLLGHGTHVASLAAGSGLSQSPPRYVGVAPDASLIVARVVGTGISADDASIILATQLVYTLAEELGMPAVVNLSLGGDFGPHDGSSSFSEALADMVGPEHPGRAMVVAAGNSGAALDIESNYPAPLGVHAEVHVPRASAARVPVVVPFAGGDGEWIEGQIMIWIAMRPGDALSIGLERAGGEWIAPVPPGEARVVREDDLTVALGAAVGGTGAAASSPAGAVIIEGRWPRKEVFALTLEGHGSASLWVQSEGDLGPEAGSAGALFPRATMRSTITLPADHPALISVGASINRLEWTSRSGEEVLLETGDGSEVATEDGVAFFSSAGPNAAGALKPDLIAPGLFVAGAMSAAADPDLSGWSIFGGSPLCSERDDCMVVDDSHAVTAGTSMASPIVAGAVALLLEAEPEATQPQLLERLRAGARRPTGAPRSALREGAGSLDLPATFEVARLEREAGRALPSPARSWIALADTLARPDPHWHLEGLLKLRADDGQIADGFEPDRLRLSVTQGRVIAPLERVAPGSWRFSVAATAASEGSVLELRAHFDDEPIAARTLPISVDPAVAAYGYQAAGGCAVSAGDHRQHRSGHAASALLLAALTRARRRRARSGSPQTS